MRRARKVAPPRGRRATGGSGKGRGGLPWITILLVVFAVSGILLLRRLRPDRTFAPPPPGDGAPGIELPEETAPAPRIERPAPPGPRAAAASGEAPADGRVRSEPVAEAPPRAAIPVASAPLAPPPRGGGLPRIAIVLDDCGQRLDLIERAVRIRQPMTFAVIPHLPHSRSSAEAAFAAGHEVIVHQPMEPESGDENPGEGALLTGMSPARVARVLASSLQDVPHAVGMNNHMGSKATADAVLMGELFEGLGKLSRGRPLYFLDSRTSARTVAREAAGRAGVPSAERDVFLDNDLAPAAILGQLDRLMAEGAGRGQAVGIGHLKPETLAVLETALPAAEGTQARFVFLGDLVR